MKAGEHTAALLDWWRDVATVDRVDLAVRRADGEMAWHRERRITSLPLSWLRAENVRGADVYVRPARGWDWPLVFLDDVDRRLASRIARRYDCAVVETSPPGGCHVWLRCARPLAEFQRARAQRWLAERAGADPASVSGEHLGRLAGFKNWKRNGTWVNVLAVTANGRSWEPGAVPDLDREPDTMRPRPKCPTRQSRVHRPHRDLSPSGQDWAWVCARLERGRDPDHVRQQLVARARPRRRGDAERYASRTVRRAAHHVENQGHPRR